MKPCVEMVPWRPQGRDGIAKLLPLCAFLFMGLMYREVLMDITDEAGDREAGVRTIPVVAGAFNSIRIQLPGHVVCKGLLVML